LISKNTIEKVFETARVEEVVGDFVQLKKSGSNFKGLSPFTDERSPSFMVSPVKQIWKDFSSGKGGNAVSFIMEHEHFTYPEAIKYLAKKYGIEIEETQQTDEEKVKASEKESMYLVSNFAKDFFVQQLHETPAGKTIGLSYFKERGFTEQTIREFELGFSPDEWSAFTDHALKNAYQLEYLEKTGLSIVKEDKQFDRFKGRMMFPIHSMSGRILGFGGRILKADKKAAKYLNSPESEIYHKSKILYGLYFAKQAIAKEDNCYLVEGYTDVIQLHQKGIKNVVASSGTALTPDQIRLINRLTQNITVLFDGDAAGIRASIRGIDLILEQGMNVKVCSFPDGEDPDSFAKANTTVEVKAYLEENATDFIQFKASLLAKESANDPIKKASLVKEIIESIGKIPNEIQQEIYVKECSRLLDISEEVLFSSLAQLKAKERREQGRQHRKQEEQMAVVPKEEVEIAQKVYPKYELEKRILSLLLKHGNEQAHFRDAVLEMDADALVVFKDVQYEAKVFEKIYKDLQDDETEFSTPIFQKVYQKLIGHLAQSEELEAQKLMQDLDEEEGKLVSSILMEDEKHRLHRWNDVNISVVEKNVLDANEVIHCILSLRRLLIHEKINEISNFLKNNTEGITEENIREVMEYKGLEVLISKRLNRVV
jgi:DNA primase